MATPPAGLDPDHPTRILGEGWNSGCSNPPELYGVEKSAQVISMFNTANIEMQCIEITDHSNCSTNNNLGESVQKCSSSGYPYGDWVQRGIEMRNVQNWYMKNINIHGITGPAIRGAEITDWTVEDSRFSYNNSGGINAETPGKTPNSFYGTMRFNHVDISWNGCVEDYPNTGSIVAGSCVGGNNGGFGDGVGLAETGGTWYWDNSTFIGNVEDGLDMLYMRTGSGISFISNSLFMHNAGDDLKTGGNTVIKNNILTGDCSYFRGKPINGDVVHCRGNATLSVTLQKNSASATIINNSLGGNSDIMVSISSSAGSSIDCDGTERVDMTNNIFRGGKHVLNPETKKVDAYYIYNTCSGFEKSVKNNLFYNAKDGGSDCTNSVDSICGQDPLFVAFDEVDDIYDFRIQSGSSAINAGLPVNTQVGYNDAITTIPATDYFGHARDIADIGMHEFNGIPAPNIPIPTIQLIEEN
ncbi:hypothetical protein DGMP_01170 [Desulfomarina profundi]|uniref:Right handed beta helix domain-containing protein n=1 Tax=Desulfomarina profundi TaxID=2772557 RepID=A0A8D5FPG8_9BACT|nr:hypothetical protein [Desulfomarina profundi]BCL59424.1 hypothetical protein DGMP_01170 [Desulfomarina profundi]